MKESRPLDFLYDSVYTIASAKNYDQLVADAVQKTSEKGVRPCYNSMFSDVHRYPRIELVCRTEEIPSSWRVKLETSKENETIFGRNLVKFVSSTNTIPDMIRLRSDRIHNESAHKVNIEGIKNVMDKTDSKKNEQITKRKSVCTKGTQTDYRDSETQTSLWIHPCTVMNNEKILDLFSSKLEDVIPTAYDVNVIEDKCKINELERELLTSKRNLQAQIAITRKIEEIEWTMKEKRIDRVNEARMECAEILFYKYKLETGMDISKREESLLKKQEKVNNQKLESLIKCRNREIRRLERKYGIGKLTSLVTEY